MPRAEPTVFERLAPPASAIDAMDDEGIVEHAAAIGADVLGPGLAELAATHPTIGDVRGLGVFWALDLVANAKTKEPLSGQSVGEIKKALMAAGLLPFVVENRIHVVPPCVVTEDEVARALGIYDRVLTEFEAR